MSVLRAARTLGRASGWTLSNLAMQKTLYIAQMIHLAGNGLPLFAEPFEAWDFGPAVHTLHRAAKRFGRSPVQDVFNAPELEASSTEAIAIKEAWEMARLMSPGQLINYTHRPGGAWEQVYQEEALRVVIPNELIRREWDPAARASDDAVSWAMEMAGQIEKSPSRYMDFEDERSFRTRVCEEHIH